VLNTAVEQVCNAITRQHNAAIQAAKDAPHVLAHLIHAKDHIASAVERRLATD
jgi:diacylglycerol kinase